MNNYSTLLKFGGANYSIYRAIKENEADNEDLNLSLGEHFKHAAYGALDTNWILTSGKLLMHFTIAQPLIEDLSKAYMQSQTYLIAGTGITFILAAIVCREKIKAQIVQMLAASILSVMLVEFFSSIFNSTPFYLFYTLVYSGVIGKLVEQYLETQIDEALIEQGHSAHKISKLTSEEKTELLLKNLTKELKKEQRKDKKGMSLSEKFALLTETSAGPNSTKQNFLRKFISITK